LNTGANNTFFIEELALLLLVGFLSEIIHVDHELQMLVGEPLLGSLVNFEVEMTA
jgi:hypothetical protein